MENRNPLRGFGKALGLICIGAVLVAVGLSLGGRWNGFGWLPFPGNRDGRGFSFEWNSDKDGQIRDIEDSVDLEGIVSADLRELEVSLKAGSLVVTSGDRGGYRATGFGKDSVSIVADNGRLRIEERDWTKGWRAGHDEFKPVLEITLPRGTRLSSCDVSLGAGQAKLDGFYAERFRFNGGAGSLKAEGITASDARIESGAGSIEIAKSRFEEAEITSGAGRIVFSGDFGKRAELGTGAGSVEISLDSGENEYRIEYERGIGSVRIGGATYAGVGSGVAGNPSAERSLRLTTGVGAVRVSFAE
jgi:DUF4097 and DUF4098 domain-containing protein YvlB